MTPEEWKKYKKEVWDTKPWFCGATDQLGNANIEIEYTAIDRTSGPTPPSSRDFVTGKPYCVKIVKRETSDDELRVSMRQGELAEGKLCSVTITAIEKPALRSIGAQWSDARHAWTGPRRAAGSTRSIV